MTTIESVHNCGPTLGRKHQLARWLGAATALVIVSLLGAVLIRLTLGHAVGPVVEFINECVEGWDVFIHSLGSGNFFCGP